MPAAKVLTHRAELHDGSAGHIFAPVRAAAFDHRVGAGIPHGKPLTGLPGSEELPRCRPVKHGIANNGVLVRSKPRRRHRPDDDSAAGEALANIVISIAEHLQLQALHREGTKEIDRQSHADAR